MHLSKKIISIGALTLLIGATSLTAYATTLYSTPAEALAGLTGKTVETIMAEKSQTSKTYGTIAKENGVLEEFKAANLERKIEIINERVANGTLTQEEANVLIEQITQNAKNCDGTGEARIGKGCGLRMGNCQGQGQGRWKQ